MLNVFRSVLFVAVSAVLVVSCAQPAAPPQTPPAPAVTTRPPDERVAIIGQLNVKRVNGLLLQAMRKHRIDAWIVMSREFNKDFVLQYVEDNDECWPGGHRNAYVFIDTGQELRKIHIGTHLPRASQLFELVSYHSTTSEEGPSLAPILRKTIEEFKPGTIAVNTSRTIPMCDGLTVEMREFLIQAIGPVYAKRLVSAEALITDFLDTRMPEEFTYFTEAAELSKTIHREVLSDKVIRPGETTVGDVRRYLRRRMMELGISTWYFNGLRVHRRGTPGRIDNDSTVIQHGDLLNNDIGISYMGFDTDMKGTGYVLRPGETAPPEGLKQAFANSLKVQDAVIAAARPGVVGHVVKAEAEAIAKRQGINPSVYCHSTGIGGHGIGAWMNPNWPDRYGARAATSLRLGAYYSVESHATTPVPEWDGQPVSLATEENTHLAADGLKYVVPRQAEIILIGAGQGQK